MQRRYCGAKPKQAACKALTAIVKLYKKKAEENEEDEVALGEINFGVYETTRGSKNKTYYYSGEKILLDEPITLEIADGKEITYRFSSVVKKASPDDCQHLIDYQCVADDDSEDEEESQKGGSKKSSKKDTKKTTKKETKKSTKETKKGGKKDEVKSSKKESKKEDAKEVKKVSKTDTKKKRC